ncbi:mediator of RNA polymerase II transcription subunit 13 [Rhizina undulata]
MESPSTCLTNILKFDNFHQLPYHIYRPAPLSSQFQLAATLRFAERTLRAKGLLVLADLDIAELWIFKVDWAESAAKVQGQGGNGESDVGDEATKRVERDHDEGRWTGVDEQLRVWGLSESSSEIFLASSLAGTPSSKSVTSSAQTTNTISSTSNKTTTTIDLTNDSPPPEESQQAEEPDPLLPYKNFITSLFYSLSYSLSRRSFTPLNLRTLVSPSALPLQPLSSGQEKNKARTDGFLSGFEIFDPEMLKPGMLDVEIYLTPLGTLFIIPHSEVQGSIRRLSSCGLDRKYLHGREVFIAPWGEWGRIVPSEESQEVNGEMARIEGRWKEIVKEYLVDRGIIGQDGEKTELEQSILSGEWERLEVWITCKADPSLGRLAEILWPKALLFLRASEGDRRMPVCPDRVKKEDDDVSATAEDDNKNAFWSKLFDDPEYIRLTTGRLSILLTGTERPESRLRRDLGMEWWEVEDSLDFAESWVKSKESRAEKIRARREENKIKEEESVAEEKKKIKEEESAAEDKNKINEEEGAAEDKKKIKEEEEQPELPQQVMTELTDVKGKSKVPEAKKDPSGVYPTPPDAAVGQPVQVSVPSSAAATTATTEMDLDWMGDSGMTDAPVIPNTTDQRKGDSILSSTLVGAGEGDLFGGDEEMEMFAEGMGVTEDDFDFFNEPVELGGFPDELGGAADVDMMFEDLPMETLGIVSGVMANSPGARENKEEESKTVATGARVEKRELERQVQTPPLSPYRALLLLVPEYLSPQQRHLTPPPAIATGGAEKTPNHGVMEVKKRMSLYSPITFTTSVEAADRKYAPGGRFFLPESVKDIEAKELEKQRVHGKRKRPAVPTVVVEEHVAAPEVAEVLLEEEDEDEESSGEEVESESDADDETDYENSPITNNGGVYASSSCVGRKRKREVEDDGDSVMSEEPQNKAEEEIPQLAPPPWEGMKPDPGDYSVVGLFEKMTLDTEASSLSMLGDGEWLAVSKILSEQVLMGGIHPEDMRENAYNDDSQEGFVLRRRRNKDHAVFEDSIRSFLGSPKKLSLEAYASILDAEPVDNNVRRPIAQSRRVGMKPSSALEESKTAESIFKILPPHIHVHRAETALDILPPALHYWETFGLGPCSGGKNFISFCLYPGTKALENAADAVLDRIAAAYEAGRYGQQIRGKLEGVENGLYPISLHNNIPTLEAGTRSFIDTMTMFGQVLANVADEGVNIVVYVVNPFRSPGAMVDIAAGFLRMKMVYRQSIEELRVQGNHLVLKVLPADDVLGRVGLVVREIDVNRVAAEIYGRCVIEGVSMEEAETSYSPAIYLSRPPPKSIEFRLTTEPSHALLSEDSALHIAYAQSLDERWVTVAWTDNWGEIQVTENYCLGRRGCTVLRAFEEVCKEIWNQTVEILASRKVHWRLFIVKAGVMLDDEVDIWTSLTSSSMAPLNTTILLSANLAPKLSLTPILPPLNPSAFNPQITLFTGTTPPVSTPQGPATLSPDQFGNAGNTPSADPLPDLDPDSSLVDYVDEVWGVVLNHRLPVRDSVLQTRWSRASGLLIKRTGTVEGDALSVLEVQIMSGGTGELREVLKMWRDLGTLSVWKGVVERKGGCWPWHLAVVERAVGVLGWVM